MICNTNPVKWLRAMLTMETEDQRAKCDICNARPWKHHGTVCGIETFYCWECAGETEAEQENE